MEDPLSLHMSYQPSLLQLSCQSEPMCKSLIPLAPITVN